MINNTGHGEVETATRFPLLHTPDGGYLKLRGSCATLTHHWYKTSGNPLSAQLWRNFSVPDRHPTAIIRIELQISDLAIL